MTMVLPGSNKPTAFAGCRARSFSRKITIEKIKNVGAKKLAEIIWTLSQISFICNIAAEDLH